MASQTPPIISAVTLHELDEGRSAVMVDKEIALAMRDLKERGLKIEGGDGKPRVVKINLVLQEGEHENEVTAKVEVGHKYPGKSTAKHVAKLRKHKGEDVAQFQPLSPDDPDQPGLPLE
jgi:hypothetical protein